MADRDVAALFEHAVEMRSQALLDTLHRQAVRVPLHMTIVIAVIAGLASSTAPTSLVLGWTGAALGVQLIRYLVIPRLNRPDDNSALRRLHYAAALSLLNGMVLASSIVFFASFSDGMRAIYTMIMIGLMSGTIASSHGYTPIFVGFVGPILTTLAISWSVFPMQSVSSVQQFSLSLLIGLLGLFLFSSSRDVFRAFKSNFVLTERLERALEAETNANAAKTRFLAAASHDLRQPLHTMSMLSAALTLRPLDTESAAIASRINEAMAQLSDELDSLLDISKLDAGVTRAKPTIFLVNPLIERLVQDYHPAALEKGLDLHARLLANPTVESDRGLLERILRNLLDNAVKYTESGSVVLEVSELKLQCSIRVRDTGLGIPHAEQLRVHEEFYQLHNPERDRKKGLGLGLSIVRRIAPLLHAKVEMVSTPGEGTVFSLSLPSVTVPYLANVAGEHLRQPDMSTPPKMLAGIHALIVEDDREVRRSMRTLLESVQIQVREASNTRQATECVRTDMPNIALVDLRLPAGDSGYDTIKALRVLAPDLPIIVISGEFTAAHDLPLGDDNCDYLVKPVDMVTLFATMQSLLNLDKRVTV